MLQWLKNFFKKNKSVESSVERGQRIDNEWYKKQQELNKLAVKRKELKEAKQRYYQERWKNAKAALKKEGITSALKELSFTMSKDKYISQYQGQQTDQERGTSF